MLKSMYCKEINNLEEGDYKEWLIEDSLFFDLCIQVLSRRGEISVSTKTQKHIAILFKLKSVEYLLALYYMYKWNKPQNHPGV